MKTLLSILLLFVSTNLFAGDLLTTTYNPFTRQQDYINKTVSSSTFASNSDTVDNLHASEITGSTTTPVVIYGSTVSAKNVLILPPDIDGARWAVGVTTYGATTTYCYQAIPKQSSLSLVDISVSTGAVFYSTATLTYGLLNIASRPVAFYFGSSSGTANTNGSGIASYPFTAPADSGTYTTSAQFNGDAWYSDNYYLAWSSATANVVVTINVPPGYVNLVATMTASNVPSPFVVTSNSVYQSDAQFAGWHAFAPNTFRGWLSAQDTGWLSVDLGTAKTAVKYTIAANPAMDISERPTAWTFNGWDGSQWVVLDSRSGITWTAATPQTFIISSPSSYSQYRIIVSASEAGGINVLGIGNLYIIGY